MLDNLTLDKPKKSGLECHVWNNFNKKFILWLAKQGLLENLKYI